MTTTVWRFSALDSLFFRDGRPMNVGESAWVDSLFPPTGQTLQGAIRAAILDYLDADIEQFQQGKACLPDNGGSLKEAIGDAHSIGKLRLSGPFICRSDTLFFPAPLDLVKNRAEQFGLLTPSPDPVRSDLGTICFPMIRGCGYKLLEDKYISKDDLEKVLQGTCEDLVPMPLIADAPRHPGLADPEPKVGLARDNRTRRHRDGMLFAIAPVRPRPGVALVVQVEGVPGEHQPDADFFQKLGGEGKLAHVTLGGSVSLPGPYLTKDEKSGSLRFKIICISPVLLDRGTLVPDDATIKKRQEEPPDKPTFLWKGDLSGCPLRVITACIGKPYKAGGWNMRDWKPKPLRSFLPAGTVFFCEAAADQEAAIQALHNTKIGQETEYGFGHIVIGQWNYTGA